MKPSTEAVDMLDVLACFLIKRIIYRITEGK